MPNYNYIKTITISSGGGTTNLPIDSSFSRYSVEGTATLAASVVIQSSGTPATGTEFRIFYNAELDFNGNTVTIFGLTVPVELQDKKLEIVSSYDGTRWNTKILVDFDDMPFIEGSMIVDDTIETAHIQDDAVTESKIADDAITKNKIEADAVTTVKIEDGSVTVAKLYSTVKKEVLAIPVSFEAGEQGDNTISIPYDFKITSVRYTVTKVIAGTDNATITMYINGTLTVPNSISITASTAVNSTASTTVTASNTGSADQQVKFVTAKTTAGGKALLTINLERT